MKTKLTSFILGGLTFLSIGAGVATSTDVLTVKPAVPKTVMTTKVHHTGFDALVAKYHKQGYLFKTMATLDDYTVIVVMEKY